MATKKTHTREEYRKIYTARVEDDVDHNLIKLRMVANPLNFIGSFTYQSYTNVSDNNILHSIFYKNENNKQMVDVYSDNDELISGLMQHIRQTLKKELKKLPLVANHLSKIMEFAIGVAKHKIENRKKNKNPSLTPSLKLDLSRKRIDATIILDSLKGPFSILTGLIEGLQDKNVLKHIKNFGINFKDLDKMIEFKMDLLDISDTNKMRFLKEKELQQHIEVNLHGIDYNSMETFDDKLNEIVLTQKTKRFIQKTFSDKYKNLINDDTFNLIKELVMRSVNKTHFHDNFAKKMARYDDAEEFNLDLRKYIQQEQGWSIEQYVEKAKELNIDIMYNENNVLTLKIDSYKQSQEVGSKQWCISYDNNLFNSYHENGGMFFLYDFNKDIDDNTSMLGLVIAQDNEINAGHWKDDTEVKTDICGDISEGMDRFNSALPNVSAAEYENDMWKFVSSITDDEGRHEMIIENFTHVESAPYIKQAIANQLLKSVDLDNINTFIKLGYHFKNEKECRNEWKEVVRDVMKNKQILPVDNFNSDIKILQSILESEDLELVDLFFTRLTDDNTPLSFTSNIHMWKFLSDMKNNDKDITPICKLLQKHRFKFSEDDMNISRSHLVRHEVRVRKYKKSIEDAEKDPDNVRIQEEVDASKRTYAIFAKNKNSLEKGLVEFEKIVKKFNFDPSNKKKNTIKIK